MGWVFVAPAMLYVVVVFLFPVLFLLYLSVVNWSPIEGSGGFVGTRIISATLQDPLFWQSLANSAKFVVASVPATVALSLLAALAFCNRSKLPFKAFFKVAYFLPLVTSLAATAFIWLWMFNPAYGLFNSLLALVGLPPLAWLTDTAQVLPSLALMYIWVRLGFNMAIFLAGLEGIPQDMYDAARIDGAGGIRLFFSVTLPLLNAQMVLVGAVEVISALRMFDLPYVATQGGPLHASRTVVLHIYDIAFRYNEMSKAAVAALLLFALILLLTLVQIRLTSRKVEW